MTSLRSRTSSLVVFDFSTLDGKDVIRGALVTAIITSIPVLNGDPKTAIPLSIGAVFAAIAEAGQPFGQRWRTMLWTTLALAAAASLGASLSESTMLAILVTVPVAFTCGLVGAIGRRAAIGGLLSLVIFSIYVGIPVPMDNAITTAALIGLGGLTQTLATVSMGVIRNQHRQSQPPTQPLPPLRARLANPVFRTHAIRLTIVMVIATSISESISIPHPYWLPMSVAWMSKPDRDGTVDRVMHRLVGTFIGLGLAAGLTFALDPPTEGFLAMSLMGAAIAIAFIWANYAVAVAGVTLWVVSLFAMVGDPIVSTIDARFLATVGAAVLVLSAVLLTTWRAGRRQILEQP